ncbi:MAG: RnfABCDGE type electron transport complex subunit B [Stenotrophobium sp.]
MTATVALAERINALLPQTQCTQCGYTGCKPYATAIAEGAADINQCPPGGDEGVRELAALLGRAFTTINPANGIAKTRSTVAVIDEAVCIGCTLCIQACPVDAIVGANQLMHTVIASECSGCELCLPPCPVDCIRMEPVPESIDVYRKPLAARRAQSAVWRARFDARTQRLQREQQRRADEHARKKALLKARAQHSNRGAAAQPAPVYDPVAAALARARAKSQTKPS